jgi:hypothetical protein
MAAPAPAPAAPIHHAGRGQVGDSSAIARPSPPPLNVHLNMNVSAAPPRSCRRPRPFTRRPRSWTQRCAGFDVPPAPNQRRPRPARLTVRPPTVHPLRLRLCHIARWQRLSLALPAWAFRLRARVHIRMTTCAQVPAGLARAARPLRLDVPCLTSSARIDARSVDVRAAPARPMESTQLAASAPSAGATEWGAPFSARRHLKRSRRVPHAHSRTSRAAGVCAGPFSAAPSFACLMCAWSGLAVASCLQRATSARQRDRASTRCMSACSRGRTCPLSGLGGAASQQLAPTSA